jgi:hypothetical protein
VNDEDGAGEAPAFVEVAKARDRLEALVWARNLEDQGIEVVQKAKFNLLFWLLYLGRTPVSVQVPEPDYERALDYLKRFRFI